MINQAVEHHITISDLPELVEELQHFCDSIDVIDRLEAHQIIEKALGVVREALNALIVEFRCLRFIDEPYKEITQDKVLRRFAISYDVEAKKSREAPKKEFHETGKPNPEKPDPEKTGSHERMPCNDYPIREMEGVWNWVYENKCPMWVEDFDDKSEEDVDRYLVNTAVPPKRPDGKPNDMAFISKNYSKKFDLTKAIIIIPFKPRLELADDVSGFLNVEFASRFDSNINVYKHLEVLTELLATVIWKNEAWVANIKGRCVAVERFKAACDDRIKQGMRREKTAIYVAPRGKHAEQLGSKIQLAFTKSHIQPDNYDCNNNNTSIEEQDDVTTAIKKAHMGVFDVSERDFNTLLVLGMMLSGKKPCLVLSDNNGLDEPPQVLDSSQKLVNPVQYFKYKQEKEGEDLKFSYDFNVKNPKKLLWDKVWDDFIKEVEKNSSAFKAAHNYYK